VKGNEKVLDFQKNHITTGYMNRNFAGAGSFGRATFGPATTLGLASLPFAAKKKRTVGAHLLQETACS